MRTTYKRALSAILTLAMVLTMLPVGAFAAEATEPTLLQTEPIAPPEGGPLGGTLVLSTANAEVAERGKYLVTVSRLGDAAEEATVELSTVDISALYATDYAIADDRYKTDAHPDATTLMEQSTTAERRQALSDYAQTIFNTYDALNDAEQGEPLVTETEEPPVTETEEPPATEIEEPPFTETEEPPFTETEEPTEARSLAQLKERQTGLPTRVSQTEPVLLQPLAQEQLGELAETGMGDFITTSSTTVLTFAPGETEQQITFEILEDEEAEGTETISLLLSNPSENARLGEQIQTSLRILDDEPEERSTLSFSAAEYAAEDGAVTLTAVRTGATYTMVTAAFQTIDNGTGVPLVDYQTAGGYMLEFAPFVTEQTVTLQVAHGAAEKNFSVNLYDLKGADAGDATDAVVTIPTGEAPAPNSAPAQTDADTKADTLAAGGSTFTINVGGKNFEVEYTKGDLRGKIFDAALSDRPQIGEYIFAMDTSRGGYFETYVLNMVDFDPNFHDNKFYPEWGENGAMRVNVYSSLAWYLGSANMSEAPEGTPAIADISKFSCVAVDWEAKKYPINGSYSFTNFGSFGNKGARCDAEGNFARKMSEPLPFLRDSRTLLPAVKGPSRLSVSGDDDGPATNQNVDLKVYGFAAFYRRFQIELQQPDRIKFRTADGSYITKIPAQVHAGIGHELRYNTQQYQVSVSPTSGTNSAVAAYIKDYIITLKGDNNKEKTFIYTPDSENPLSLDFSDASFLKLLDDNTLKVEEDALGYSTKVYIKPVFERRLAEVTFAENKQSESGGSVARFKNFSVGDSGTTFIPPLYIGDQIDLAVDPSTGWHTVGYNIASFASKSDNNYHHSAIVKCDSADMIITLEDEKYILTPVVSQTSNCIEVKIDSSDKDYIKILNEIPEKDLPKDFQGHGRHIIAIDPTPGQVYTIQAVTRYDYHTPVWELARQQNIEYSGSAFDMVAQGFAKDNEVRLHASSGGTRVCLSLDGTVLGSDRVIRPSAVRFKGAPMSGVVVSAGGYAGNIYDAKTKTTGKTVFRQSATTGPDGTYTLNGIVGLKGTYFTYLIDNGDTQSVSMVSFSYWSSLPATVSYTETELGDDGKTLVDVPKTAQGYRLSGGANMSGTSPNAPLPYSIEYAFGKNTSYAAGGDTRNTEIPMFDDTLTLTLSVNSHGRRVKAVEFVTRGVNNMEDVVRVDATSLSQTTFTHKISMLDPRTGVARGDKLFVRLIDAEPIPYETQIYDKATDKTITEKHSREMVYPLMYTGLSFYLPSTDIKPKTWDYAAPPALEIGVPIFEKLTPAASSGALSVRRENLSDGNGDGVNAPYAITVGFDVGVVHPMMSKKDVAKTANTFCKSTSATHLQNEAKKNVTSGHPEKLTDNVYDAFMWSPGNKPSPESDKLLKDSARESAKKSTTAMSKAVTFNANFNFVLADSYVYDNEAEKYVSVGCQYVVGMSGGVGNTHYWLLAGKVPVFLQITGKLSMSFKGYNPGTGITAIDEEDFNDAENLSKLYNGAMYGDITLDVKASVGVGLCGILGARGIVGIKPVFSTYTDVPVEGTPDDPDDKESGLSGVKVFLTGGFSIDLVIFSIAWEMEFDVASTGFYNESRAQLLSAPNGGATETITTRPADFGSGDLGGFGGGGKLRSTPQPVEMSVLLKNAPEHARPTLTQLPDGKQFLAFVARDSNREGKNALALYYSIYSGTAWSTPAQVDGDGTLDTYPQVGYADGKVLVAWSDANKTFDAVPEAESAAQNKAILSSLEIAYRVYDVEKGAWDGEAETITANNFMDANPQVSYDAAAQRLVVYYHTWDYSKSDSELELADPTLNYNTLRYRVRNTETKAWIADEGGNSEFFLTLRHPYIADPLVLDFSQVTKRIGNDFVTFATYTVDGDNDMQTSDDRNVYLYVRDLTSGQEFYPQPLSTDYLTDAAPMIQDIGGKLCVSWLSNGNTLKFINLQTLIDDVAAGEKSAEFAAYANSATDANWPQTVLKDFVYEAPTEADIGENFVDKDFVYKLLQDGTLPIVSKQFISDETDEPMGFAQYRLLAGKDNNLYLLWTAESSADPTDFAVALYGSAYLPALGGWGEAVKLTHRGDGTDIADNAGGVIDRFSATADEDGNMTLVANGFTQSMTDDGDMEFSPNDIVAVKLVPTNSTTVKGITLSEDFPKAGSNCVISVATLNDGLLPSKGRTVTLYAVQDGVETQIGTRTLPEAAALAEEPENPEEPTLPADSGVILPGATAVDQFEYKLPADISGLSFVAKTTELNAEGVKSKAFSLPVAARLDVQGSKLTMSPDESIYSCTITNTGNAKSAAVSLTVDGSMGTEGSFGTIQVPELAPGASVDLAQSIPITPDKLNAQAAISLALSAPEGVLCGGDTTLVYQATAPVALAVNGKTALTLKVNERLPIAATLIPANIARKQTMLTADNSGTFAIDPATNNLVGVAEGTGYLTVTHVDTGLTEDIPVTVTPGSSGGTGETGGTATPAPKPVVNPDGSKTTIATNKTTGVVTETTKWPDGTAVVAKTEKTGEVTAEVTLPAKVAKAQIFVSVAKVSPTTVAVLIAPDGTRKVIRGSVAANGKVTFPMTESGTVAMIDNAKTFTDVKSGSWETDPIAFVTSHELFQGTAQEQFSPIKPMSRAMLVTVLHRLANEPGAEKAAEFADVQGETWYADAVAWAAQAGIAQGGGTGFAPEGEVTREQVAVFLWRYAKHAGEDVSVGENANILSYTDAALAGEYAIPALQWACAAGILTGKGDGKLDPLGHATRAEVAALLQRFVTVQAQ